MSDGRQRILDALRDVPARELPAEPEALVHEPQPAPDILWQRFAAALEGVGGAFLGVHEPAAAAGVLADLLAERGVTSAALWEHELLNELGVEATLAGREIAAVHTVSDARLCPQLADAGAGVTAVHAAIAETGTLVLACEPGQARATSLVPPLHVALVAESMLVPTLDGLPRVLETLSRDNGNEGRLPSAVALITGPSCTADIEQIKIFGAHGPVEVLVIGIAGL